jgi:phospholipid/cholesterol/gamma-HCH transport system substrate-binding protein
MNDMRSEFMVGIFAIAVMAILSFMTFRVGEFSIGKKSGYVVYAYFNNTAGLSEKTRVKIAGVSAGTVEDIVLIDGTAKVAIRIDKNVRLYSDAVALIKSSGLLGDKFMEISIGSEGPELEDGDVIINVIEVAEVDDLVKNLTDVSAYLNDFMKEVTSREISIHINNIMANLDEITARINTTLEGDMDTLSRIARNIEEITESLKDETPEILASLNSAVYRLDMLLEETSPSIMSIANRTDSTMGEVEEIAAKINSGEGTIGKLVSDERLYDQIASAAGGVSNTISRVDRFRTFITFRGDYLYKVRDGKGTFTVELSPRENKSYILGIVSDPVGRVTVTETTVGGTTTREEKVEQRLEFIAQFARRFSDSTLRIGLTENTFGLGADQHLFNDRVKLTFDAWDFGEDEALAEDPHVRIGADIYPTKHIFISGGYDNALNSHRAGYFLGGGIRFEDEDFKYLFGSMPSIPGQ